MRGPIVMERRRRTSIYVLVPLHCKSNLAYQAAYLWIGLFHHKYKAWLADFFCAWLARNEAIQASNEACTASKTRLGLSFHLFALATNVAW